jgi:hypothetical protein
MCSEIFNRTVLLIVKLNIDLCRKKIVFCDKKVIVECTNLNVIYLHSRVMIDIFHLFLFYRK